MPNINLATLPRVEVERIARTFTDPRCPGVDFTFEFGFYREAGDAIDYHLQDLTARLEKKYVVDNLPVTLPGSGRIPIERTLCLVVANMIQAENVLQTECAWGAEDWFRFSMQAPSAWGQLQAWYLSEQARISGRSGEDEEDLPNTSGDTLPNG